MDFLWKRWNQIRNTTHCISTKEEESGTFLDYYESGWQECFPASSCGNKGASFGLLGEVCNIPFSYEIIKNGRNEISIKFWVRTYRTPYYLEKFITLRSGYSKIFIRERVVNEGEENLEFVWGNHAAIGEPFLDKNCFVELEADSAEILFLQDEINYRFEEDKKFK